MKSIKYYIYPIVLIVIVITLSILHIHGSSIDIFSGIIKDGTYSDTLIFGKARAIRSDEYLVSTPTLISQDLNNESTINPDIGDGENLGTHYNLPTDNIFSLFKPAVWIFFITNNIEFSFSFFWWIRIALFLLSIYVLLLEFTKKNILLSIAGSLLFYFTPFIQWWLAMDTITPISFGIFLFIRLIKTTVIRNEILYGLGLTFSVISFAIIAYPPFQIPLVWIAVPLAIAIVISNWKNIRESKNKLIRLIAIGLSLILITGVALLLYFKMFNDATTAMMGTVYPGSRFIQAGLGNVYALLDGFYNILMQKDSNGAPFANQSEASNFFALYPFLLPWTLYKVITNYIKSKKLDWIVIALFVSSALFAAWYFLPLPELISKISFLYLVLPQRLYIGFGYAGYLLLFYIICRKEYHINLKVRYDIAIAILLAISSAIIYYKVGIYLYTQRPESFLWPTILSPNLKILGVTLLVPLLVFLVIYGKKLGILILLGYAMISTIYVNPLYQGLGILIETDMAKYMQEINKDNDKRWIVYGDNHYTQYLLANGGRALNGIHMYPQFKIWSILDPKREYIDTYNRYAHIFVSDYQQGESLVTLLQADALELNISPCDPRLKNLDVEYVLSTIELQNKSCLKKQKTFGNAIIYTIEDN